MKKIFYLVLSLAICRLFKTEHIWIVFTPVVVIMTLFKVNSVAAWEIPLGCLALSVLETAFADNIISLLRVLIPVGAAVAGYFSPKKLVIFFPAALCALFYKNIYSATVVWAIIWVVLREALVKTHSITKSGILQEYKS